MDLCPTLLVERYEFSQQLQKSLRASSARDIYIPRKGRLINTCCAKVICSEELLDNEELGQGALEIPVTSTRQPIPILEKYTQQEIASDFQPKLLRFRLTNYNRVRNSNFDVPEFESSARDLARCLGSCVSEDPELQTNIAPLLEDRNQEFSAYSDCSKYINGIVVETLFFLCHEENKGIVQVKEATSAVNTRLRNRGEMLEMTPKQVGNKLRAMGLTTMRLNAYGRGIRLLDPVRRRIHKLACDYGVAFGCTLKGDDPRWRCPYCARGARQAETEPLDIATLDELGI
jgi:hypothetical protein